MHSDHLFYFAARKFIYVFKYFSLKNDYFLLDVEKLETNLLFSLIYICAKKFTFNTEIVTWNVASHIFSLVLCSQILYVENINK